MGKVKLDQVCFAETEKVYLYRIGSDSWEQAPDLILPRMCHSSCLVGDAIYVCGGSSYSNECESIERLSVSNEADGATGSCWETLNVAAPKLSNFLMLPGTSNEIIFLGGKRKGCQIGEVS